MNDNQLREAMESCRPGRDDLALAEMTDLANRLESDPVLRRQFAAQQRHDAELSEAFQDVPVPTGLLDQLLATVGHAPAHEHPEDWREVPADEIAQPEPSSAADGCVTGPSVERAAVEPVARRRLGRRAAMLAIVAGTAACLTLVVSHYWDQRLVALDQVEADAQDWVEAALVWPDESWRTDSPPPPSHPVDPRIRVAATGWHELSSKYDGDAIVYRLPSRGSGRAMLMVVRTRRSFDLPAVPHREVRLAGDWSAGAWKSNEHLYVLAARNTKLSDYLRAPQIAEVPRVRDSLHLDSSRLLVAR